MTVAQVIEDGHEKSAKSQVKSQEITVSIVFCQHDHYVKEDKNWNFISLFAEVSRKMRFV